MLLHKIETGNFMLDGGAMFGTVPKVLWNKVYPANENNLCNLSMRCLLIETENNKILIDSGIGEKQDDKFFGYYYLNGNDSLENSLAQKGFKKDDITDVILTHLHFDHVGGAIVQENGARKLLPAFKNATYYTSASQWEWAMKPNRRERASYLQENILPLKENGVLKFIESEGELFPEIDIRIFNGHTQGLVIPIINFKGKKLVYMADLIPTSAHIPASWICGYDTQPLVSMKEREMFLDEALTNNYTLFFEHDIAVECCTLKSTEKGIRAGKVFTLDDFVDC